MRTVEKIKDLIVKLGGHPSNSPRIKDQIDCLCGCEIGEVVIINISDTLVEGTNKLDISINTAIRKALNDGKFPVIKNGGYYYYPLNISTKDLVGSHTFMNISYTVNEITIKHLSSSLFDGDTISRFSLSAKKISYDA